MNRGHTLWTRIADWFHGTNWSSSVGGYEPDSDQYAANERVEFLRRQEQVRARLERLETLVDTRTGRKQDE